MNGCADRLSRLDLSIRQTARLLEVPRRRLAGALEEDPAPRWLIYSLDGLEKALAQDPRLRLRAAAPEDDVPEPLQGDRWAPKTARLSIPVLVDAAINGTTLTYKELDEVLRARDPKRRDAGTLTKYGFALGRVGQTVIAVSEKLDIVFPPIEALVVNGNTELPGEGIDDFLKTYLIDTGRPEDARRLRRARADLIALIHQEIFRFDRWDDFLSETGNG